MSSIESKIVVIGPPDVGKTCLSVFFIRGRFSEHSTTTIGASFLMKTITTGNVKNTLKIWDTAGQEVFRSMSNLYYKDIDGAILVFDGTNPETLKQLNNWYTELKNSNPERDCIVTLFIACNKMDLNPRVDTDAAEMYAKSIGARLFYTSAKTGMNVNELFTEMAWSVAKKRQATVEFAAQNFGNVNDATKVTISTDSSPEGNKKKCCC